jgi:DNA-binding NtrC family response regulator
VQCAAVSEAALESELFGQEPVDGTEVGAHARGVLDEAHEGTILLDNIDALSPALQGRLLRFLGSHDFRRVGGTTDIRVDVRIIAATTRSLEPLVHKGVFRSDLYYRLNVLGFEVPPLASHPEDIALLARHFVEQNRRAGRLALQGVSASAESALTRWWPGNVDELRAVIDRAAMLASGNVIDASHLPGLGQPVATFDGDAPFQLPEDGCSLDAVEKSLVLQALERAGGNQTRAATLLGVHRDQIRYRLGKYHREAASPAGRSADQ